MSRVIDPNSAGKTRNKLMRVGALTLREMARRADGDPEIHDLVACMILVLEGIADTIEPTVTPWEKRGYWVKADRFRLDWEWAGKGSRQMKLAFLAEDWDEIAEISAGLAVRFYKIKISPNHRMGKPWAGAWGRLKGDGAAAFE